MVIASPKPEGLSARRLRDAVLVERISAVHRDNYGVYGVRKMWHALHRDGIDIGRAHTARLMRRLVFLAKAKAGHQSQPEKLTCLIYDRIWWSVFKAQGP